MITGRDVDKIKRLSSVLSTGTNLRTKWGDTKDQEDRSDSKFQVLQLSDNEIGSTVYDTLYSMFRKSLIKDMFQKEFGVTDQQALNALRTIMLQKVHQVDYVKRIQMLLSLLNNKLKIALNHMLTEKLIKQMLLFTSDQNSIRD